MTDPAAGSNPAFPSFDLVSPLDRLLGLNRWRAWRQDLSVKRRLCKVAEQARSGRIALGDRREVFEELPERRALLDRLGRLGQAVGIDLRIFCRSRAVLADLDKLVELDSHHAVTVDLEIGNCLEESLRLAEALAEAGLSVRLSIPKWQGPTLFAAAKRLGAVDVIWSDELPVEVKQSLEGLRLVHGFPAGRAGRG